MACSISYPPVEKWHDWVEYDTAHWPKKVEKHYQIIPTICFNCEAACGLLADCRQGDQPYPPLRGQPSASRQPGPQLRQRSGDAQPGDDPERILYPLKRAGKRGEGKWERATWDEVFDDIAGRVRKAILEDRRNEIMYHVGRPGR